MTKVKICGCRTPSDIQHASEAGADFVGMVVAPNTTRFVPAEDRLSLVAAARESGIPLVCVLRNNQKPSGPMEAQDWYPGDMVQWHGQEGPDWASIDPRPSIRAVSGVNGLIENANFPCQHFLLDHDQPGSGQPFDWNSLQQTKLPKEWILAGGLHPLNVDQAVRRLRPWAVDVSSGVESSPGAKCADKIRAFVDAVRQADCQS